MKDQVLYKNDAWDRKTVLAAMETNDCVVRAIASSFSITYEESHSFVEDYFQRKSRKGTRMVYLKMKALREKFGKSVQELGIVMEGDSKRSMSFEYKVKGEVKYGSYTTARFLKEYSEGTYFILISRHAFCIKDGVIHGNPEDAERLKARIQQAFKIG